MPDPSDLTAQLELAKLRASWGAITPQLDQLQALAANGWYSASGIDDLIPALLREVTLLRAERLPPPLNHNLQQAVLQAFGQMSETMRLTLHRTEKTVQQLRYDAYEQSIETLIPTILANGRMEMLNVVKNLVEQQMAPRAHAIAELSAQESQGLPAKPRLEQHRAAFDALKQISHIIAQLMSGGLLPGQGAPPAPPVSEVGTPAGIALN